MGMLIVMRTMALLCSSFDSYFKLEFGILRRESVPFFESSVAILIFAYAIESFSPRLSCCITVLGFLSGRLCLVRDQRFGTVCVSHHQGLIVVQGMISFLTVPSSSIHIPVHRRSDTESAKEYENTCVFSFV
jgi:hypothetical protein